MNLEIFKRTIPNKEMNEIFIKPICDLFEITYEKQAVKIKNDSFLMKEMTKKSSKTLFGDNHPRISLTKKGFVKWILGINPITVRDDLRQKFEEYQDMLLDYLYGNAEREEQMRQAVNERAILIAEKKKLESRMRTVDIIIAKFIEEKYYHPELPFSDIVEIAE